MRSTEKLIDGILQRAPGVERGVVATFLGRLESDYFATFDPVAIAGHFQAFVRLSVEHPVQVLLKRNRNGLIDCVILAFDHPFEFSSITGIMAATGYNIERSDAFTLRRVKSTGRKPRADMRPAASGRDPLRDAVILDYFQGRLLGSVRDFAAWAKTFTTAIEETIGLLDQDSTESMERAKRLVNERVTRWLARRKNESRAIVSLEVAVEQLKEATRLRLRAPDTPAFLYALSTALSLHGLQIEKTRARTDKGTAIDEINVVDREGAPLADRNAVQRLERSVLLTLQFSYFLDRASDPFTALQRFEELARQIVRIPQTGKWLELLANPLSMIDLAKLLGASHFLWEDFTRWNADALLPVLQRHVRGEAICPPAPSLPRRLEQALAGAKDFDEERNRLNEFKDRELFLIDLDHILAEENPDEAFRILSERLVFLAENLLAAASRRVHAELVRLYGRPRNEKRQETGFAIFGLGKFGGVALGYASDIELLFLFEEDGVTDGGSRGSLTNGEFFAILTRETCAYIRARREGISQVDLRLRPHGSGGPLANSRSEFASYYGAKGAAHAFEKLALVRLRWIAGSSKLGYQIERLRDQLVYEGDAPDFAAIWEVSRKMRAQHAKGSKHHSKHGEGALADLEQTVQMLQVLHAGEAPQLRTPRLHEAMDGLRRAGIVSPEEFEQLMGAYQFMRRLINAQRMLRGSARDLLLPAEGSDELAHLARRMGVVSEDAGEALLREFTGHTELVKRFMRRRFGAKK
jgi:[glutamine synthetase] adenylyltransferase / [glutamine synthetase]-adenylyl-L-tyrosine phosphorylase